ncbi:maestro heat-like repeat-containing protein family member 1 [Myotis yumanensis]|uniref:maestro heat-like repeat-containing protein family member 1 n=1 Tax=Myotis yumanensis TaxID=159337 RepID=UPI0038CF35C1
MVAVGKIILSQDTVSYIGSIWRYIQPLLKLAQEENDMLAICHVFYGLVISAHKHLDSWDDKVTGFSQREMSMKAYITFRVFLNRWTLKSKDKAQVTEQVLQIMGHLFFLMPPSKLKNQVNRLTRWLMILMSTKVTPFYISQCICQLVNALALSGCGGINLESQLENITGMLFQQLCEGVNPADPHSVENHSLALRAFFIMDPNLSSPWHQWFAVSMIYFYTPPPT